MNRTRLIVVLALAAVVVAGAAWWVFHPHKAASELTLYGNVDLRQVDLAFNDTQRVEAVVAVEGDRVRQGQVLARLDTSRLAPAAAQAAAEAEAQAAVAEKLRRGNRPEDIAQARANVDVALADDASARVKYVRTAGLAQSAASGAVSRQDLDDARAAADSAAAKLRASRQALRLQVIGSRREDIDQAAAQLKADQAQQALLQRELADAVLTAPLNAVVRSRLVEPGDMSSPQKPAFSLAITDPKWVRAYVTEADLGAVHPGMRASVSVDAFPKRLFAGWVGFISPVAEFTPKTVQTPDLRTSLVYQIRVFVKDPQDELRLGMPATVHLPLGAGPAPGGG
jgi:HlyD family secretion protein